jgi:Protein of unknown function (DUF1565)
MIMGSQRTRFALGIALFLVAGAAPAVGQTTFSSHPPMRSLPVASKRPLAKGPTYFVHPTQGDDTQDGSEARPWKTIQHGVKRLKPGDTLYLRGGTYYEKVHLPATAPAPRSALAAWPIPPSGWNSS